ncbi:MAG: 3-hydroxyacyl-CoA dehydrogenase, partial [Burkholderiaceae bacterium]
VLASREAPSRAILCAGAGSFARAYVTLTEGIHVGSGADAAERVAARWDEVSERSNESVPQSGAAQGQSEIGHALRASPSGGLK